MSGDFHEILLDEVLWGFDGPAIKSIEDFYSELQSYNKNITGEYLEEEITYDLEFSVVYIEFHYRQKEMEKWKNVRKRVRLECEYTFSELILLYHLHNEIQCLFRDYDRKYLEGLELLSVDPNDGILIYELILGS